MTDGRCPYCNKQMTTGGCDCEGWNNHFNPPVTYTHTTRAVFTHPIPDDSGSAFEISQRIGKMISDGIDEYFRLSALGYRLMRPDEMIDSGDKNDDGT